MHSCIYDSEIGFAKIYSYLNIVHVLKNHQIICNKNPRNYNLLNLIKNAKNESPKNRFPTI